MRQNKGIEQRNGGYYLAKTRISLDSIVHSHLQGVSTAEIAANFPLLSIEQIGETIAFYEQNKGIIDLYLTEGEVEFNAFKQQCRKKNPVLYNKLSQFEKC